MNAVHRRREKGPGGLALALGTKRQFATTGDDLLRPLCCCSAYDLLSECTQGFRLTRASMCPDGSSVGTNIWLGLSCPNRDRSIPTRYLCPRMSRPGTL